MPKKRSKKSLQLKETTQGGVKLWELVSVASDEQYCPNINECIKRGKDIFPDKDFFIVNNGAENEMANILSQKYYPTLFCPEPRFDQVVFRYSKAIDNVVVLWALPDKEHCDFYNDNRILVVQEERELLGYIDAFHDGTLEKLRLEINGN